MAVSRQGGAGGMVGGANGAASRGYRRKHDLSNFNH
jgi:hypothetical protein